MGKIGEDGLRISDREMRWMHCFIPFDIGRTHLLGDDMIRDTEETMNWNVEDNEQEWV